MDTTNTRSVNLKILCHVWDIYTGKKYKMEDFRDKILGISKTTLDNMIASIPEAGKNWDYKKVAEKLKMDVKVFTGEYLIKIDGNCMKYLRENIDRLIKEDKDASLQVKRKALSDKGKIINESLLWELILENKSGTEGDIWRKSQTLLLQDIAAQVKEEHFNDLQLWKFWDYLRKNYARK